MAKLPRDPLVAAKLAELESVMRSCAGLWLEALVPIPTVSPGDTVQVQLTAINRSPPPLTLTRVTPPFGARAFYLSTRKIRFPC
jgi:hypothetical protein